MEPRHSSGRMCLSLLPPDPSKAATYQAGSVSLDWPHRLHDHCAPPSVHPTQGLIYARHLLHRGGPPSPKSTNGICGSTSSPPPSPPVANRPRAAKGHRDRARGSFESRKISRVAGTQPVVALAKRGEQLPVSSTKKSHQAAGGTLTEESVVLKRRGADGVVYFGLGTREGSIRSFEAEVGVPPPIPPPAPAPLPLRAERGWAGGGEAREEFGGAKGTAVGERGVPVLEEAAVAADEEDGGGGRIGGGGEPPNGWGYLDGGAKVGGTSCCCCCWCCCWSCCCWRCGGGG